jgi:hypothetical protein
MTNHHQIRAQLKGQPCETSARMTWKSVTNETGQIISVRIPDPVAPYADNQLLSFVPLCKTRVKWFPDCGVRARPPA